MKRLAMFLSFAALMTVGLSSCGGSTTKPADTEVTYTCPMHPEVEQDTPGQCNICGMDLVEKKAD